MTMTTYKSGSAPFRCTVAQAEALDRLSALNKGGIGSVIGYKPTSNLAKGGRVPVHNLQIITRFDTAKLYDRKRKALEAITFADVAEDVAKAPKLKALSVEACLKQFNDSKAAAIESLTKTLDGDRSDAHRQGHDRCYIKVADGVKINLVTEKVDGLEQPVLTEGLPTLAAILLPYIELKKTVVSEGDYHVANSGPKVLMDNVIKTKLNSRSVGYKTLSLKADNFTSLNVSKQTFTPTDLAESANKSKLLALLEACGFHGDALALMEALEKDGAKL